MEVDGDVFDVKISPLGEGNADVAMSVEAPKKSKRPEELPPGAVVCGMAGMVLSIDVKGGDRIKADDLVAVIEAMKMRRHINSPHDGTVKEIFVHEGEIVAPDDILMIVE